MKKIILSLLLLSLAASSVFALTPKEVLNKAFDASLYMQEGKVTNATFIIEAKDIIDGVDGTIKTITVVDQGKWRKDSMTYSGNELAGKQTFINIPQEGTWVMINNAMMHSYRHEPPSKKTNVTDADSKTIEQIKKIADSAVFVTGDSKSNDFYVIDVPLGKDSKYRLYVDKTNYTISEVSMSFGDMPVTIKYSDYRKVLGNHYYPYRIETEASGHKSITEVTSFKVVTSKDVASYFVIPTEQEFKSQKN